VPMAKTPGDFHWYLVTAQHAITQLTSSTAHL
jgi:hypothetical protein